MSLREPIVFETAFARYRATNIVGQGGSGRVYEALDEAGDAHAVKLLDSAKATKTKLKRFKNELFFCINNQHPNVVTVTDHGFIAEAQGNAPFYVMPLYSGSLRKLLERGVATNDVLDYFSQILNGVEAAHIRQVVHRDLKPENFLYDEGQQNLLLADFGVARFEEDELHTAVETKPNDRLANFQYAAPEQRGRRLAVDGRADIYALGLILNEMFTGQVPYGTEYKEIRTVTAEYSYLDDLVSAMLRQAPEERPSTIRDIKMQLGARREYFVTQQRIGELSETDVPVAELDDPLVADPPELIAADWDGGMLSLTLSRPVDEKWQWALQHMGTYTSVGGTGPEQFAFSGDVALVGVRESEVQAVIDHFKRWLPKASKVYEKRVRQEMTEAEQRERRELQRELEREEARQRVRRNIRI